VFEIEAQPFQLPLRNALAHADSTKNAVQPL
jgi:hypothetical protein